MNLICFFIWKLFLFDFDIWFSLFKITYRGNSLATFHSPPKYPPSGGWGTTGEDGRWGGEKGEKRGDGEGRRGRRGEKKGEGGEEKTYSGRYALSCRSKRSSRTKQCCWISMCQRFSTCRSGMLESWIRANAGRPAAAKDRIAGSVLSHE